jgi:hypothetical protein
MTTDATQAARRIAYVLLALGFLSLLLVPLVRTRADYGPRPMGISPTVLNPTPRANTDNPANQVIYDAMTVGEPWFLTERGSGQGGVLLITGWSLIGLGLVIGVLKDQLSIFTGQPSQPTAVLGRALIAAAILSTYNVILKGVWDISLDIGRSIANEHTLGQAAFYIRYFDIRAHSMITNDWVVLAPLSIIRNAFLQGMMWLLDWFVSFSIDAIRIVQLAVFNVVYGFGPICLGLYVMGLRAGEIWFGALLEVCSWNITIAIILSMMAGASYEHLMVQAGTGVGNFEWWENLKGYTFLAFLITFVPVLSSRFFGIAALGPLAGVAMGGSFALSVGQAAGRLGGSSSAPKMQGGSQTNNGDSRP